ncbi:MAG TPA: FAD-dependent oxidoreductase, partial [Allosphingosinicella sp.]
MKPTRRELLAGAAALAAARPAAAQVPMPIPAPPLDVAVVGAGVFGAWTAKKLQDAGWRVLLLDPWGPAHARASSGGESRMTRGAYGADEIYTRMALSSLAEWQMLSRESDLPIFAPTGVLFFFPNRDPYALATIDVHRRLGL